MSRSEKLFKEAFKNRVHRHDKEETLELPNYAELPEMEDRMTALGKALDEVIAHAEKVMEIKVKSVNFETGVIAIDAPSILFEDED